MIHCTLFYQVSYILYLSVFNFVLYNWELPETRAGSQAENRGEKIINK
jgi:hypothetical protein